MERENSTLQPNPFSDRRLNFYEIFFARKARKVFSVLAASSNKIMHQMAWALAALTRQVHWRHW